MRNDTRFSDDQVEALSYCAFCSTPVSGAETLDTLDAPDGLPMHVRCGDCRDTDRATWELFLAGLRLRTEELNERLESVGLDKSDFESQIVEREMRKTNEQN